MSTNFWKPWSYKEFFFKTLVFLVGIVVLCIVIMQLPKVEFEQSKFNGVIVDEESDSIYREIPIKPDIDDAIDSTCYDLLRFCPDAGDQGDFGTCVGWASAYAARTICEAADSGWTEPRKITSEVFSPWFVYTNIKNRLKYPQDYTCQKGTYIPDALQLMKDKGVPKIGIFDSECTTAVPPDVFPYGERYKIDDYFRLFDDESHPKDVADSLKLVRIKRALINNRPVLVAMKCYTSFSFRGEVWDGDTSKFRGYHAMCVVGFCDEKFGGSFLIQNSWGKDWGVDGRCWVRYDDFINNFYYACEMYMKPHYPDSLYHFSAGLKIEDINGKNLTAVLDSTKRFPFYKTVEKFDTTMRFKFYISNREPAYVYMIGGDDTKTVLHFPANANTSPALVYRNNNTVSVPDDSDYFYLQKTVGADYMCLLFSTEPIDIHSIINDIENEKGNFYDKILRVLSSSAVAGYDINFSRGEISFTSKTRGKILPLIVRLD